MTSRFIFVRVHAAHHWQKGFAQAPREEWLIAEWPDDHERPTDYWISNLPADTEPEQLARLARLRWKIELDYKQLKGELGLDHYEGRSWLGWYHHTALVTAAHGFLTLERLHPFHRGRPDTPPSGAAPAARLQVLGRPLPHLQAARRPRPATTHSTATQHERDLPKHYYDPNSSQTANGSCGHRGAGRPRAYTVTPVGLAPGLPVEPSTALRRLPPRQGRSPTSAPPRPENDEIAWDAIAMWRAGTKLGDKRRPGSASYFPRINDELAA